MPAERTTMRQVREVLRLKFVGGVPTREIARRIGVAASTVRATIKRFQAASVDWPLPDGLSDAALEARLFPDAGTKRGHRRLVEPDWASIHRELKRKHVTLSILWDEYIERNPEGYRYSRYVAAAVMWRKTWAQAGEGWFPWLDPQHNFELRGGYRAFRNVISDGSARGRGLVCRSVISTRASALAFISISTSA
jgi:hypothetical protein